MTVSAFVLVECTAGHAKRVAQVMRKMPEVLYAHAATGPYDVIALLKTDDLNSLGELVMERIQAIPGVIRTQTSVVVE
jgi:DNA-binding Lrp family transcriptional regulator